MTLQTFFLIRISFLESKPPSHATGPKKPDLTQQSTSRGA